MISTALIRRRRRSLFSSGPYFPRTRNEYGLVYHTYPAAMVFTPAQVATLPTIDTFSIPAGIGNTYAGVPTAAGTPFYVPGAKIVVWITVDNPSSDYLTPFVRFVSATLGTQNIDLVEETPGTWVYEATIPASGYSAISLVLTNNSASNAITGTAWQFAISPVGASGASPQDDVAFLTAWAAADYAEAEGNLWPIEKQTLAVTSGDTIEAYRGGNGITIDANDDVLVVVKIETTSGGNPAIVDRVYMRAVTEVPADSQNVFLFPLAGHPGYYGRWFKYDGMSGPSGYFELNVDNAQSGAWYTQEAVTVTAIQVYRNNPPTTISSPALLSYEASDGLVVRNFPGQMDVYTPLFASNGNEYMQWQTRQYDTTGDPLGGGIGNIMEDLYTTRRTGTYDFCPVYNLTDVGLWETSMKMDDGSNEHIGHDVHKGSARRSAPLFQIDTGSGWETQDVSTRLETVCDKVRWIEYQNVYDRADGTTVIATHDTEKVWEGNILKVYNSITFPNNIDMLVIFPFMPSFYTNIDNLAGNGTLFSTITMPNQGGASYTPGGGVDATYPAEKRFLTTSANGPEFDIEVKSATPATFRSWWQSGSTRKLYLALVQADSFGLVADRTALSIPGGTTYTMETWMTVTK